jgi:hypothetical protein
MLSTLVRNQRACAYDQRRHGQHQTAAQDDTDRAEQSAHNKGTNARGTSCRAGFLASFAVGSDEQTNAECDTQAEQRGLIRQA